MRYRVLDFYRFCAATLVMGYHFIPFFKARFGNFNLCVDFFFMLSGFVVFCSYAGRIGTTAQVGDFLVGRLARLYPLHLATALFHLSIAGLISTGLLHIAHADTFNAKGLMQNLLLVHAWGTTGELTLNVPSWSISAEWAVYLLFPLFVLAWRRGGEAALALLALASVFGLEAMTRCGLAPSPHWTEMSWDFGALRAIPSFVVGVWLALRVERDRFSFPALPAGLALFCGALVLIYAGAPRLLILIGFALALYLTACGERKGEKSFLQKPLFSLLGDASYAVYLLHLIVLAVSATVLRPLVGDGALKVAAAMLITIIAAIACHRWFEKPIQHRIKGWWRSLASRPATVAPAR